MSANNEVISKIKFPQRLVQIFATTYANWVWQFLGHKQMKPEDDKYIGYPL